MASEAPRNLYVIPQDVRFSCQQCGLCCRGGWNIPLVGDEAARLRSLDWSGRAADLIQVTPTVTTRVRGQRRERLARTDGGACVFLGDRNQCRIHEHFGAAAKPYACRSFPFSFRPMGDRLAVDVAFSCLAVSRDLGPPVGSDRSAWPTTDSSAIKARDVSLTAEHRLDPELALTIEQQLLDYLGDGSLTLRQRIRCCQQYLRLATTGDPATAAAATLRSVIGTALPDQIRKMTPHTAAPPDIDRTQAAVFYLWTYLVLNPSPPDLLEWDRRRQRQEEERRAAIQRVFRDQSGRPWVDNRELSAEFAAITRVEMNAATAASADVLAARFLAAKIVGQRFLQAAGDDVPLVDGARRLFLSYPVLLWTAKALAADAGRTAVANDDLTLAIRLVDRSFDKIRVAALPRKQRDAWDFLLADTDIVLAAAHMIAGPHPHPHPNPRL